MSLQEKFQTILPHAKNEDDGNEWVSFKSARDVGTIGKGDNSPNAGAIDGYRGKFNLMPPGADINDTLRREINNMPLSLAGASDVSKDTNQKALDEGFIRQTMHCCDDQYTGEHLDHFYGEAVGDDGNEGFVERNNYLDRI